MLANLVEIKRYKNPSLIDSFSYHHPEYSLTEVQQLFEDLLAWMWLSSQRKIAGKKSFLFGPLLVLDEVWHAFILRTRDYFDFCQQYFGEYFHHEVEPPGFEHEVNEAEMRDFLQDCFNLLDSGWVTRRFADAL